MMSRYMIRKNICTHTRRLLIMVLILHVPCIVASNLRVPIRTSLALIKVDRAVFLHDLLDFA